MSTDLRSHIRDIPDFPKPGIVFKDITPLLLDPPAIDEAVDAARASGRRPLDVDLVLAAEARGFILGAALARELGAGFVPARKPGKLPDDEGQGRVPARVRRRRAGDARRRAGRRRARARPRRPAGHRRDRAGAVRARRAAAGRRWRAARS